MTNVQEHPLFGGLGAMRNTTPATYGDLPAMARNFRLSPLGGDSLVQCGPPPGFPDPDEGAGGLPGIVQQLLSIITQLLAMLGLGGQAMPGNGANGAERYFQDADASSQGDPHLRFNGNGAYGPAQTLFDSMTPHADLLDSNSFPGGYQVSTQTTPPGANGITYNQQATVSTNYDRTHVSLDKDGNATVVQDGRTFALQPGQNYDLGNGEVAQRGRDGSLTVTQQNAQGGRITTTMRQNGNGIDVSSHAHDVDLGGDLPASAQAHTAQEPRRWEAAAFQPRGQVAMGRD